MSANCQRSGGKVEGGANACGNRRQTLEIWKANGCPEAVSLRGLDDQYTAFVGDRDRACIPAARHRLDAGDCPRAKERQNSLPVVGRPIAKLDRDRARRTNGLLRHSHPPKCRRWPLIELPKGLVESPNASKAGCQRNLCHRQSRVLNQL